MVTTNETIKLRVSFDIEHSGKCYNGPQMIDFIEEMIMDVLAPDPDFKISDLFIDYASNFERYNYFVERKKGAPIVTTTMG